MRWLRRAVNAVASASAPALALALALSLAACGSAAASPYRWEQLATPLFVHLGQEQGLPHPVGMTLAQDGDGYIWIGTQNGLARWDGYRMRSFHNNGADPTSLPGDFVQTLHVDALGRLWVGTASAGLAMYDKRNERFVRLNPELSTGAVNAITSDAKGNLWVGTPTGLIYYDTARGTLRRYTRDNAPGLPDNQIRALLSAQDGTLWIGCGGGLARLRPGGQPGQPATAIAAFPVSDGGRSGWSDAVLALGENRRGQIGFGTLKSGIGMIDPGADHGDLLKLQEVKNVQDHMVLGITETVPGVWWASTYGGGVVEYHPDTGRSERILHQPAVAMSLSNDRAAALLRDRSGMVWITTEQGVDLYDPHSETIDSVFGAEGALEASVTALMNDSHGDMWIALADKGIDIVPPRGVRRAALRPDPDHPDTALPNRVVLALAPAGAGEAWIGTQLGLYRGQESGHRVRRVPLPMADPYPRIGTILVRKDQLWLGTFDGLLRYDPAAGTVRRYGAGPAAGGGLTDNRIHMVLPDADGALWIGTRNGLNRLDPDSGRVEQIKADPRVPGALRVSVISALAFDTRGRLWVGTNGGGIAVMTGRDANGAPRFHHIGTADGLKTGVVMAMQSDRAGRVWAATSDGIAVIDPGSLKARAMGRADGLAFRTFFIGASAVTPEDDLLFGATSGLAVVYPTRLNDWGYRPPLVLSALRLDRRELTPEQLNSAHGPTLTMKADSQGFEAELAALDYSAPQLNRYAYLLEGLDSHWTDVDASRRIIAYGHLPAGSYRLRLRGSNREGLWNADELSLRVEVLPAWYQTWWARLAYLLAACGVAWGLYGWRLRRLLRTGDKLQALVYSRTRHLEKLNAIVKSINEQMDFDALLHTILHESTVIKGIDTALALVRKSGTDTFALRAAWGRMDAATDAYQLDLRQAEARYAPADCMIAPDIFEVHHADSLPGEVCALLSVRVVIGGRVEGYLIFENYHYRAAFEESDLDLLKALKEPFTSAYLKARAMRMIENARANAEAATRAKSDFLANISHEIRTPMNAILGFAGLGTHLDLPPQPLDYFRKIGRAGQSLLEIINDVLDFSKIESGKLELEALPFDLPDTLNQIADLFSWRAAERGLELVIWAAPDVPSNLLGDPLRLSQILVNLVGNALKFTASGHIELRVELEQRDAGGGVLVLRFTVEDSGLGISGEQQARLFQAFAQADTSTTRLYGGTGLGLAISQQLVRKMGGVIQVDSEPGVGSSFSFCVWLQPAGDQTPRLPPLPPSVLDKRVLVVDDSETARHMLKIQLAGLGLRARAVASGAAAVAALQLDHYDLLLIDADMPDLSGVETMQRIAADAELAAVPAILMVTAYGREHNPETADQARLMPFIDKPANPYLLRAAILHALGLETSQPAVKSAAPLSVAVQRIRGAHVLVIDDNNINQQVASEILQRAGVKADLAASGEEGARMALAGDYDAVLMDIQMPDMDGYQATALIRASGRHGALPIIAMTAHAVAGYRERCLDMDMNDYITKPIDPDTLYAVLATWIQPKPDGERGLPGREIPPADDGAGPQPMVSTLTSMPTSALALPSSPASTSISAVAPRAGIDVDAAMERLGGHEALLSRLLGIFAQDFSASLQQIEEAIRAEDYEAAADLVHKIKGAAGNISATELFQTSTALEDRLHAGQAATPESRPDFPPESLPDSLQAFVHAFGTVMHSARIEVGDPHARADDTGGNRVNALAPRG